MILTFIAFLTIFYSSILVYHFIGWRKTPVWDHTKATVYLSAPKVTILVPARNEEHVITKCLDGLYAQDYKGTFEVLVVDDHSTDNTDDMVERYIGKLWVSGKLTLKLIKLEGKEQPGKSYKKHAITTAIKHATGDIIITTDADCSRGTEWLKTMVNFMQQNDLYLVSAPVEFISNNRFEKMQSLEFWGLIGIGAAAIRMGTPNMCNGANMAYRKQVFNEVGGYAGNEHLSSGDDEFLMHKIFKRYPQKVAFLKNSLVLVGTQPQHEIGGLMEQRKRWVSKSVHYQSKLITLLMALVYLYNVSLVFGFIAAFTSAFWFQVFIAQFSLKLLCEGVFLRDVLRTFNRGYLLAYFFIAQPLHILYVLYVGVAGNLGSYQWKGRQVK